MYICFKSYLQIIIKLRITCSSQNLFLKDWIVLHSMGSFKITTLIASTKMKKWPINV